MAVETIPSSPSSALSQDGAAPTPASKASLAFGLGWHVAELFYFDFTPPNGGPRDVDALPGIDQLSPGSRADLLRMQLGVGLERLGRSELAQDAHALELSEGGPQTAVARAQLRNFHERLLKSLAADDPALARSYDVGRTLSEMAFAPIAEDPASFASRFSADRIQAIKSELGDLIGQFPARGGEAVDTTLDAWRGWVTEQKLEQPRAKWSQEHQHAVREALQRQGQLWYALLSGDMDPSRLLSANDYMSATRAVLTSLAELAWSFMTRIAARIGLAPMLVALIVAVGLGVAVFFLQGTVAALLSFVVVIALVLGVSMTGMRGILQQVLKQSGDRLWEAELLTSIGHSVTRLPELPSRSR